MINKPIVKIICKEIRKAKRMQAVWNGFEDCSKTEEQRNTYFQMWRGYRAQERALKRVLRATLQA